MRLPFFIARRYLFSKKKQKAINIISAISVTGVTIGTTALIVVLSVFNGMDILLQQTTDSFTPDLIVSPASGKYSYFDSSFYRTIKTQPDIASYSNVIEEKALARYEEQLLPVVVKGVDSSYAHHSGISSNLLEGTFQLQNDGEYQAIMGYGVAAHLQAVLHSSHPITLYYPDAHKNASATALNTKHVYPVAYFSSQQDIDAQYVIVDLQLASELFDTGKRLSKVEIRLTDPSKLQAVKEELSKKLPDTYRIADKYQLNQAFYAMMKSEKLAVFLILLFILFIASFNIVGSISMLILDKQEDLTTYKAVGMTDRQLVSIFKTEGNLITLTGTLLGLIIGTGICFIQEKFGLITLGDGSYIVNAYPVKLVFGDLLIIVAVVLFIGYIASYFPVRYLIRKLCRQDLKL